MTDPTQTQRTSNNPEDQSSKTQDESPFERETTSSPLGELEQSSLALEMAKEWVRQHQMVSMLGAFAIGVFIGALMRD